MLLLVHGFHFFSENLQTTHKAFDTLPCLPIKHNPFKLHQSHQKKLLHSVVIFFKKTLDLDINVSFWKEFKFTLHNLTT